MLQTKWDALLFCSTSQVTTGFWKRTLFSDVDSAQYGHFKRDNCRGEDKYGRGLRQESIWWIAISDKNFSDNPPP
jgi:hypothetical protein